MLRQSDCSYSTIVGPFDRASMQAMSRARLAHVHSHQDVGPYVHLMEVKKSVRVFDAEVLRLHRQGLREAYSDRKHSPAAVAWVAQGSVDGLDSMVGIYADHFAEVGITMRVFKHRVMAEAWLACCLRAVQNPILTDASIISACSAAISYTPPQA